MDHPSYCKLHTFYKQKNLKMKERSDLCIYLDNNYLIKQESMTRSKQLPYSAYVMAFLQTDLFLDYLFLKNKHSSGSLIL